VSEQKPTLLPWRCEDRTSKGEGFSLHSPGADWSTSGVAHYVGRQDAEFICRAVNVHQKLIDSLQFLVDAAQAAVDGSIVASHKGAKIIGAIEIARVTLALAKDDEEAGGEQ